MLRPMETRDIELVREQRNRVLPLLRQEEPLTATEQRLWWESERLKSNHYHFMIYESGLSEPSGYCSLRADKRHQSAEFGIITFGSTNAGYFAMKELLDYGFNELGLNRIWSDVIEGNSALRLYNILGFKNEGILRNVYRKGGAWKNSTVIGLLRGEYEPSNHRRRTNGKITGICSCGTRTCSDPNRHWVSA